MIFKEWEYDEYYRRVPAKLPKYKLTINKSVKIILVGILAIGMALGAIMYTAAVLFSLYMTASGPFPKSLGWAVIWGPFLGFVVFMYREALDDWVSSPPTNATGRALNRIGRNLTGWWDPLGAPLTTPLWLIPAAMLLLALAPQSPDYYIVLRTFVTLASAYLAYRQYKADGRVSAWSVALVSVALVFNPVFPLPLGRHVWAIIGPATAVLLVAHLLMWRRRSKVTHP